MIHLVVGGARSGKTAHALSLAEASGLSKHYVATARAEDDEMAARIARHRAERGDGWSLVEEPLALSGLVGNFSSRDCVVVDCLTLWLTNWLCSEHADRWEEEKSAFVERLQASGAQWLLVSNETGMGVVPMGELSRRFVDESGWLHQAVAAISERVTLVMFGLPTPLKS